MGLFGSGKKKDEDETVFTAMIKILWNTKALSALSVQNEVNLFTRIFTTDGQQVIRLSLKIRF